MGIPILSAVGHAKLDDWSFSSLPENTYFGTSVRYRTDEHVKPSASQTKAPGSRCCGLIGVAIGVITHKRVVLRQAGSRVSDGCAAAC